MKYSRCHLYYFTPFEVLTKFRFSCSIVWNVQIIENIHDSDIVILERLFQAFTGERDCRVLSHQQQCFIIAKKNQQIERTTYIYTQNQNVQDLVDHVTIYEFIPQRKE